MTKNEVEHLISSDARRSTRRSFLTKGALTAGAATLGTGLLGKGFPAFAEEGERSPRRSTKGDAAILRFLLALELIESDLWQQYAELGGTPKNSPGSTIDVPFAPTGVSPDYIGALQNLDGDMPQYIVDNTDDEFSHAAFLKAFLEEQDADLDVLKDNLDRFRNLPSSKVNGVPQIGRLTNLMQLTVDTSWWTRYRSDNANPDFGDKFDQAVPDLFKGPHPAIPRAASDLSPKGHIQAIANTAAFHFGFIEQGGSSLYPSLAQRVSDPEVLRILLSIGPTETSHFQTWHDKAGNAVQPTLAPLTDPTDSSLTFPDLNSASPADEFQTNLIMPEPTIFLRRKFPPVSIIRPTETEGAAMGAVNALTADGLFIGQDRAFFTLLHELAEDADEAKRGF